MTVHRLFSFIMTGIFLALLVCIRIFEVPLFQDPLHVYFHGPFQNTPLPVLDKGVVIASTSLRFFLNMICSLGIIYFLFKKVPFVKGALWVYLFSFILLLILFLFGLNISSEYGSMLLFYSRRFLIHPILLFVLIAGFFYLKEKELR